MGPPAAQGAHVASCAVHELQGGGRGDQQAFGKRRYDGLPAGRRSSVAEDGAGKTAGRRSARRQQRARIRARGGPPCCAPSGRRRSGRPLAVALKPGTRHQGHRRGYITPSLLLRPWPLLTLSLKSFSAGCEPKGLRCTSAAPSCAPPAPLLPNVPKLTLLFRFFSPRDCGSASTKSSASLSPAPVRSRPRAGGDEGQGVHRTGPYHALAPRPRPARIASYLCLWLARRRGDGGTKSWKMRRGAARRAVGRSVAKSTAQGPGRRPPLPPRRSSAFGRTGHAGSASSSWSGGPSTRSSCS